MKRKNLVEPEKIFFSKQQKKTFRWGDRRGDGNFNDYDSTMSIKFFLLFLTTWRRCIDDTYTEWGERWKSFLQRIHLHFSNFRRLSVNFLLVLNVSLVLWFFSSSLISINHRSFAFRLLKSNSWHFQICDRWISTRRMRWTQKTIFIRANSERFKSKSSARLNQFSSSTESACLALGRNAAQFSSFSPLFFARKTRESRETKAACSAFRASSTVTVAELCFYKYEWIDESDDNQSDEVIGSREGENLTKVSREVFPSLAVRFPGENFFS